MINFVFRALSALFLLLAAMTPAAAGPPYITDDPEPTDFHHWEIYAFDNGTATRDGVGGETGLDFNYGAAPDLQLTAVIPIGYAKDALGDGTANLGNIELAAKYRIIHQEDFGLDVAIFPRVFLPSGSARVGERHVSLLLPLWIGKDFGGWSAFGGGGCEINRGADSQDFCLVGAVVTHRLAPDFALGAEIYHQSADTRGGKATTSVGIGAQYDLSERYHLLGYAGTGIQNADSTNRFTWYGALLIAI